MREETTQLAFPDESFDFVVNNQVLEHVEDIDSALAEIHRVLKPNAQVLSLFPGKSVWREGHCGIPFLHWFLSESKIRVYYAAFLRSLGIGYFKSDKPMLQWSMGFCEWLDKWTWYRTYSGIHAVFQRRFVKLVYVEEIWLQEIFGQRMAIIGWLSKSMLRWLARKLSRMVFFCTKAEG